MAKIICAPGGFFAILTVKKLVHNFQLGILKQKLFCSDTFKQDGGFFIRAAIRCAKFATSHSLNLLKYDYELYNPFLCSVSLVS